MSFDPALRVFLIARALRIQCRGYREGVDQPDFRLMNSAEVEVMLYALRRRWVPSLNVFFGDYMQQQDVGHTLIVPLCEKKGIWGFSSDHNSPTLLRTFWRAVIEMVFGVALSTTVSVGGHPFVFHSVDGNFEIEVSDDHGNEWYFIVHSALVCMEDVRSLAGTPDVVGMDEDALFAA